uniref:Uncharacterized protein n=1 Tax=Anguilla anguilla TaxID=7936 RepID=A0A0E9VYB9_ANGAN
MRYFIFKNTCILMLTSTDMMPFIIKHFIHWFVLKIFPGGLLLCTKNACQDLRTLSQTFYPMYFKFS